MKNSINTKRFIEKLQESAFTYTLISIIIGFIVGAIALLIAGYNPIESYGKLFGVYSAPRRIFHIASLNIPCRIYSPAFPSPSRSKRACLI